jgi:hypothetical protein
MYSRRSNNPHMRAYYNKYCKILGRVIKEAKRQHYSRLIEKSDKIKTTLECNKTWVRKITSDCSHKQ